MVTTSASGALDSAEVLWLLCWVADSCSRHQKENFPNAAQTRGEAVQAADPVLTLHLLFWGEGVQMGASGLGRQERGMSRRRFYKDPSKSL